MKNLFVPLLVLSLSPNLAQAQYKEKMDLFLRAYLAKDHPAGQELDLFIHGEREAVGAAVRSVGGRVKLDRPGLVSARVPLHRVEELAAYPAVHHFEFRMDRGELMNDSMRVKNMVNLVHAGTAPLPQGYDGTGVVVGFIDSGMDIMHPDFRDENDDSRVYRYWDQVPGPNAQSPQPFGYGREWTQTQLNSGGPIPTEPANLYGHGSTVAGTGVGNGLANGRHKGVAPKADIIVVATNFGLPNWTSTVADGVAYILAQAQALGKPAVINASLGSYLGSHDGKDAAALFIQDLLLAQGGRSMVTAAGNYHYQDPYHMQTQVDADTSFTWFNYNENSAIGQGAVLFELWADAADFDEVRFAVGCDHSIPTWQLRGHTPFRTIDEIIGETVIDTLYSYAGNNMAVVNYYATQRGGQINLQVVMPEPDSLDRYFRFMTTGNGKFDVWSHPIFGTSRMIMNLPTVQEQPDLVHYVLPDRNKHMIDSWACLPEVVTVANYCNEVSYIDYAGNPQSVPGTEGDISPNSSAGPTRDERMKPDVAATGDITFTAAPLADIQAIIDTQNGWKVDPGGMHVRNGGTSMASPVVAGTVALYLQKCPDATAEEIVAAIQANARADAFSGAVPNNRWGMGKLDAFNTVLNKAALSAPTTSICEGAAVEVNYPPRFASAEWSNGTSGGPTFVSEAGDLSAVLLTPTGCVGYSDTLSFTMIPAPPTPTVNADGNELTSSAAQGYQWYQNGSPIPGAMDQTFVTWSSGSFFVEVTGANGCTSISESVQVVVTDVNGLTRGGLAVWPSPAREVVHVSFSEHPGDVYIDLISADGKRVRRLRADRSPMVIELGDLDAGVYSIEMHTDDGRWVQRFVKADG